MPKSVRIYICWLSFLAIFVTDAHAQLPSRTQAFVLSPSNNTVILDYLTIEESIQVFNADSLISAQLYTFDKKSASFTFLWPSNWTSLPVELTIKWNYYPLSLPRFFKLNEDPLILSSLQDSLDIPLGTTNYKWAA